MSLEGSYNPSSFEADIYKEWESKGYFKATEDESKESYTIVIPPPNVTGVLHMGHVLNNTIQDTLIRFKRMQGFNTLWMPGSDHAGIATQNKVERMLLEQGISKEELGRKAFIEKTWQWKEKYGGIITEQLRKLGASCDWSRESFTMDEHFTNAVNEIFVKLFNDGLVYRGEYMVNWCPHDMTALADDEVNHIDKESNIWTVAYKIKDSSETITIATTRPETILGDSAIAVHPLDVRYQHLIGKMALVPMINREVPIIADEYVERDFGTGALKVTPSHDPNDFTLGKKHNLAFINIFTEDAKVNEIGGEFCGQERFEARKNVLAKLTELGQLVSEKHLKNAIGCCYRCDTVIESRVSTQWFVKMAPLAKDALAVVKNGDITLFPERWEKVYYHWLDNIRDWCISRQIWWGHRIPAHYCEKCGEMHVSKNSPTICIKCGASMFRQDEDVLDTWFSSWLWPFATMGWPNEDAKDLKRFYPTRTLVTGADILFFWVARMIMAGLYAMDEIPFSNVLLHGIVRDEQGRKMSKSLGNSPEPLDLIEKYGADAIRFSFLFNTSLGSDTFYSEKMIEMGANFANKLWNASKLVSMNTQGLTLQYSPQNFNKLGKIDQWIISRLHQVSREASENMDKFYLNDVAKGIYDFIWKDFCDWYLELSKVALYSGEVNGATKDRIKSVMHYVFSESLKLLHPLMPFITEKIFKTLNLTIETVMLESYPKCDENYISEVAISEITLLQEAIRAIRNIRTEYQVQPGKKISAYIVANSSKTAILTKYEADIIKLTNLELLSVQDGKAGIEEDSAFAVASGLEFYLPLSGLVDFDKERERLVREIEKMQKEIDAVSKKVNNPSFVSKANPEVVEKEKEKLAHYESEKAKLEDILTKLSK
ncbi:MAG: valine--tRNA ligase [Fusobacteria bacterium]|nr:valine--tRNA ligase [Fusobacteriota bacterium]